MKHQTTLLAAAIALVFSISVASAAQQEATKQSPAQTYRTECGACHIAYPPVFLPAASWDALLNKLDDHFGDDAELDDSELAALKSFLKINNYDTSRIRQRTRGRYDTAGTPLRVTETRFFQAIHHEIPRRLVEDNPAVKTFSQCNVCHRGAERGSFGEDDVHIPRK